MFMKRIYFTLMVSFFIALSVNAQIKYDSNGIFTIGPTSPVSFYPTTVYGSMYLTQNGGHFFQIDITPAATRLASHDDQVVFYNTQTSTFNSIQVKDVYNYSDARAKTNIQPCAYGLDIVKKLRPVTYNFVNNSGNVTTRTLAANSSSSEIGLLAQEVEGVLPNVVITDSEGKKLINYTALIPVLIEAVQSLQAEVDSLKTKK